MAGVCVWCGVAWWCVCVRVCVVCLGGGGRAGDCRVAGGYVIPPDCVPPIVPPKYMLTECRSCYSELVHAAPATAWYSACYSLLLPANPATACRCAWPRSVRRTQSVTACYCLPFLLLPAGAPGPEP